MPEFGRVGPWGLLGHDGVLRRNTESLHGTEPTSVCGPAFESNYGRSRQLWKLKMFKPRFLLNSLIFFGISLVLVVPSANGGRVIATPTQPPLPSPIPTDYVAPSTPYPVVSPSGLGETFFEPSAPPNVTFKTVIGVLVGYGFGMAGGGFAVQQDSTKTEFYFTGAYPVIIYGTAVYCRMKTVSLPATPSPVCPDWPSKLVVGTTRVKVTYWTGTDQFGNAANLSNTIGTP
jgi:hypothetical protein